MNATFTQRRSSMIATARLVGAAEGRQVRFQGFGTRYVVSAEQTGGGFAVVDHELAARARGAPMHTHGREDEISHVTAGRLGVQIGNDVFEAGPGDTVVKPRGVAHALWNAGERARRFL